MENACEEKPMQCQTCGKEISSDYQFCPYCGYTVDRFSLPTEKKEKSRIFSSPKSSSSSETTLAKDDGSTEKFLALLSIILLVLHFPIGIVFMWVTNSFSKSTRWLITWILIIVSILGLLLIILWTSSPNYIM